MRMKMLKLLLVSSLLSFGYDFRQMGAEIQKHDHLLVTIRLYRLLLGLCDDLILPD
jgi:hypothetical protein